MRTLRQTLTLVVLIASITSCTQDMPLINSFNDTYRLMFAGVQPTVAISAMPENTVVDGDVYRTLTGATQTSPYVRMAQYRDEIYCLAKDSARIDVLSRRADTLKKVIDLSAYGPASDICFVNATTAYATQADSNVVLVIDLTTYKAVATIAVGKHPVGIAAVGNQICVAEQGANTVSIIDSRTNAVVATLPVAPAPTYVGSDPELDLGVVVCLGAGKIDADAKTTPKMSFINVVKKQVVNSVDLTNRASDGPMQMPGGLVVTATGSALVPCQQGLLRVLTSSRTKVSLLQFDPYTRIGYNVARAEVLCVGADGTSVTIFDDYGENTKATATAPAAVGALIGLAP